MSETQLVNIYIDIYFTLHACMDPRVPANTILHLMVNRITMKARGHRQTGFEPQVVLDSPGSTLFRMMPIANAIPLSTVMES